jgi:Galactose mutarotase-like
LDDTVTFNTEGKFEVKTNPYRLYNLDVSEYTANETYLGLYGSIPFLMSQPMPKDGPKGNAAVYWINSAETWAEVYTANYT